MFSILQRSTLLFLLLLAFTAKAQEKPNILVIMGDDIGIPNISHYSHGMMGYAEDQETQ